MANWSYGTLGPATKCKWSRCVRPGSCRPFFRRPATLLVRRCFAVASSSARARCRVRTTRVIWHIGLLACGGMDNMCTVYDINNRDSSGTAKMVRELMGYEGFLSCCRFVDDSTLVTGSGDQMLTKWDLITGKKVHLRSLLSPFCSQFFLARVLVLSIGQWNNR